MRRRGKKRERGDDLSRSGNAKIPFCLRAMRAYALKFRKLHGFKEEKEKKTKLKKKKMK